MAPEMEVVEMGSQTNLLSGSPDDIDIPSNDCGTDGCKIPLG
jgi:hypothetical protein